MPLWFGPVWLCQCGNNNAVLRTKCRNCRKPRSEGEVTEENKHYSVIASVTVRTPGGGVVEDMRNSTCGRCLQRIYKDEVGWHTFRILDLTTPGVVTKLPSRHEIYCYRCPGEDPK